MPQIPTIQVSWPGKFGKRIITINADEFDPDNHKMPEPEKQDTAVKAAKPKLEPKAEVK